jgi:hypothetical protein
MAELAAAELGATKLAPTAGSDSESATAETLAA